MDFWNENQVYKWDILGDFQLVWKWLIGTFELKVETEVSILNLSKILAKFPHDKTL